MDFDVMAERYSTQDAAFALQHGNFGDFQRNLRKGDFLVLPRETSPGPGAEFRYGHLVELDLAMHIGAAFSRDVAKGVTIGLFRRLQDNDTGLRNFNALSFEDQQAVNSEDGSGHEGGHHQFLWYVNFPHIVLGSDLISRDPENPTFIIFNPLRAQHLMDVGRVKGSISLAETFARVVNISTEGAGSEEYRRTIEDTCHVPGVVNLTSMLCRLDERLAIRLRARAPIGQRKPIGA